LPSEQWHEVFCYFGNANWPSNATYRESADGERVQYRMELNLKLEPIESPIKEYGADPAEVADFLAKYQDCQFIVHDSYEVQEAFGGGRVAPSLFLIGWKELTEPEELAEFQSDKANFYQERHHQ
jgi:hypothetical protein